MKNVGTGRYTYQVIDEWGSLPSGLSLGQVTGVGVSSHNQLFLSHRGTPPILVFDLEGNYLNGWGSDAIADPHGIFIGADDTVCIADRSKHTASRFTPDGRLLLLLGTAGSPSNTECMEDGGAVPRPAGPFNRPTRMVQSPEGTFYVSDGYRNSRVHRFSRQGEYLSSWGTFGKNAPGAFHLPHSLWVNKKGVVYVCDRENSRIQIFSSSGEFIGQWADLHRPTDIFMDADGLIYISELLPRITVLDEQGNVLSRMDAPRSCHGIGGDSSGNLYLAQVAGKKLTKYRRH